MSEAEVCSEEPTFTIVWRPAQPRSTNSLLRSGLISEPDTGTGRDVYCITPEAWRRREELLRSQGLRHPALVSVNPDSLGDVVVALLMVGSIENARLSGGMLGTSEELTLSELECYLPTVDRAAIEAAVHTTKSAGLVREASTIRFQQDTARHSHIPALKLTGAGQELYRSKIQHDLQLLPNESILDLLAHDEISIFNSWQSEFNPSRSAIDAALSDVVCELNATGRLWRPLRIVLATQPGDGAARIDVSLLERIKASQFFIGDLTPVAHHAGRLCPNDNVLVEVGYALASKPPEQIILLAKNRSDWESEGAQLAFDIAHVRRHMFNSKTEARNRLRIELEATLTNRKWLRPEKDPAV